MFNMIYYNEKNLIYRDNLIIQRYNRFGTLVGTQTFHNTAGSVFIFGIFYSLVYQQPIPKINAIAIGSKSSGNVFVSASFCGTTGYGTQGNLLQSYSWGSYFALFRGTIAITSTMYVTDAQIGSAYQSIGNNNMFYYVYAYKNDVNSYYYPGDSIVVSWYLNIGL